MSVKAVPDGPAKPLEEMTEAEVREWKAWLEAEGTEPGAYASPPTGSGSRFDYDDARGCVVETTAEGERYRMEVRGSDLVRAEKLEAPPR